MSLLPSSTASAAVLSWAAFGVDGSLWSLKPEHKELGCINELSPADPLGKSRPEKLVWTPALWPRFL